MKTKIIFFALAAFLCPPSTGFGEEALPGNSLRVEIQIGTGVENRQPTGVSNEFPANVPMLVGWSKVEGASSPIEIRHVWSYEGREQSAVTLPVTSPSFRTWTRKSIHGQAGRWTLDVKDANGNVIASKDVQVTRSGQ